MRESCVDAVGQTVVLGDKIAHCRTYSSSVRISRYEVIGFTDNRVRVAPVGDSRTRPSLVTENRIVKVEDQS